jgi:hypothetical protein
MHRHYCEHFRILYLVAAWPQFSQSPDLALRRVDECQPLHADNPGSRSASTATAANPADSAPGSRRQKTAKVTHHRHRVRKPQRGAGQVQLVGTCLLARLKPPEAADQSDSVGTRTGPVASPLRRSHADPTATRDGLQYCRRVQQRPRQHRCLKVAVSHRRCRSRSPDVATVDSRAAADEGGFPDHCNSRTPQTLR